MALAAFLPDILAQFRTRFCKFRTSKVFIRFSARNSCSHMHPLLKYLHFNGFIRVFPLDSCSNAHPFFLIRDFKGVIRFFPPDSCSNANPIFLNSGFQCFYPLSLPRILLESAAQLFFESGISVVL